MNLIEALKTGKKIRRPGTGWWSPNMSNHFDLREVMAEDWETKPEKKPRMLAYRLPNGLIQLLKPENLVPTDSERVPHLDEPAEK